jgi:hypothetical protein
VGRSVGPAARGGRVPVPGLSSGRTAGAGPSRRWSGGGARRVGRRRAGGW